MAKHLTDEGRCPACSNIIIRVDNDHKAVVYLAIKSMRIRIADGSITGECPRCKNELALPAIKVRKTEMSKVDVNIFRKNFNKIEKTS